MMLRLSLAFACAIAVSAARAQNPHGTHGSHAGPPQVGTVAFANTRAPAVQEELGRAVGMLHSFWPTAGNQAFAAVLERDPGCAVATWGIAALAMGNPLAGVGATPADAARAQAAIERGRTIGAGSQRERDYIEAVAAYYQDFAGRPERARQVSRAAAFEALAARYPDDDEAQIFAALYIAGTQAQSDQTFAAYARAVAILEPQLAKHPDHPGVAHYLIHSFDAPPLAAQGVPAAMRYAGLAPDAPHAQHMPSHIFTRVGRWQEVSRQQCARLAAAVPGREYGEAQHASDYMVYAELQLGRDAAAQRAAQAARALPSPAPAPFTTQYAQAAMPARIAVERGAWQDAADLPPASGGLAYTDALNRFARAIGAARSGDPARARQEVEQLGLLQKTLADAGNAYWAAEVGIQLATAAAWASFAAGDRERGLTAMREAADREDRQEKHIVTPGRILPARELLGDMLLEAGQPAAALAEYEASQVREPNRFRGYYGAARAAEAAGQRDKATAQSRKLLELAKDADTERVEIAWARARS